MQIIVGCNLQKDIKAVGCNLQIKDNFFDLFSWKYLVKRIMAICNLQTIQSFHQKSIHLSQ